MKDAILFYPCLNSRSTGVSFGIYAFQHDMFHGLVIPEEPVDGICRLYRNTFFEAPIIAPSATAVFAAREEVFRELSPFMEVQTFETVDEFLFHMPYELGRNYLEIGSMAAWPEKFIADKSILLHPVDKGTGVKYIAFDPMPIRKLDSGSLLKVEIALPYGSDQEPDEGRLVKDATLLDRLGMVGTRFGTQVSERLYEKLAPHLLKPWYVTARVPLTGRTRRFFDK